MVAKIKHKQASVALNNNSVIIYYTLKGIKMRYPTGISLDTSVDKNGNYDTWDYVNKKLKLRPYSNHTQAKVDEMALKQKTINDLLDKANDIINDHFERSIQITPDQLSLLMGTQQDQKISLANTGFFEHFKAFIEIKRKNYEAVGSILSLKDYNSTYYLLEDYQAHTKQDITIHGINLLMLKDLRVFAASKHPSKIGNHQLKSKGEMRTNTFKKRLDVIAEFFGYLKQLSACNPLQVDMIKDYKRSIKKESKHKETLTIPEIHAFYKHQFDEPHYQMIQDLFVFLCMTGIRFQDLVEFDKRFIKTSTSGAKTYVKIASKTKISYNIPLSKIVIEILEKYGYKLPTISNAYGNRLIKEALAMTGLFDDVTEQIDKVTKDYKNRYDAITLHKARNTFITNLVDTTPLNELMKYSGHRKLSTLQSYIDVKRPVSAEYIKIFD